MTTQTYLDHYKQCIGEAAFSSNGGLDSLRNLSLSMIDPCDKESYNKHIQNLAKKVDKIFCNHEDEYETSEFCKTIKNSLQFEEVQKIFDLFYDRISKDFYGCHFTTNSIDIYRNHFSNSDKESSWLWHYDDNPEPQIKLFIYLSDVEDSDAPFTYLADREGNGRKINSSRISSNSRKAQEFPGSRIPDGIIGGYKLSSYQEKRILGKKGTSFLFDPNIIHRATVPDEFNTRDVLVFHIHPTSYKVPLKNIKNGDVKSYDF